ncbi:MAG: hypothetical protein ACYDEJ_12755 [Desulfitobacteriaceae bacterium]
MISDLWLGYKWNELSEELEKAGIAFSYKVTTPRGRVESWGDFRVVRFRMNAGSYEFILANEKFSVLPKLTP